MELRTLTGTALLLAVALLSQSLRFILPVPPMISMFLIGSLVGLSMLVATMRYGAVSGLVIAWVTPVIAFMQSMLPFAPFIPLVGIGNSVFVILGRLLQNQPVWLQTFVCSVAKGVVLYGSFSLLFMGFSVPYPIEKAVLLTMSWPQLITGAIAVMGARFLLNRKAFKVWQ